MFKKAEHLKELSITEYQRVKLKVKYFVLIACIIFLTYVLAQYSVIQEKIIEKKSGYITVLSDWSPLNSFSEYGGLAIECSYQKDNVEFSAHACDGSFFTQEKKLETVSECDSTMSMENESVLSWVCFPAEDGPWWNGTKTFVEITMLQEQNIIGYAVVQIEREDDLQEYSAQVIKCVEFPRKINGEYQKVSEEQIKAAMEDAKQKFSE